MEINIKKLIQGLEAPFQNEDSVAYCFCDSCLFLWEMPLTVFNDFASTIASDLPKDEFFFLINCLKNPKEFRKKYYFIFKFCQRCTNITFLDDSDNSVALIREISDLRSLVEGGIGFMDSQSDLLYDETNLN